jgi:hypothetical protein
MIRRIGTILLAAGPGFVLLVFIFWWGLSRSGQRAEPIRPIASEAPAGMELIEELDGQWAGPSSNDPFVEPAVGFSIEEEIDEVPRESMADVPRAEPATSLFSDARKSKPIDAYIEPAVQLTLEQTATTDTSLRNEDYPRTYISSIRVDLTSPNHWVRLTWSGPDAASQETGPFHSSPGRGLGTNDCDDEAESNRVDSNCTPKGTMRVQGFSNTMPTYSHCRFVTWFLIPRGIAFHSYPSVPNYPASHGCVRLNEHAAQLIHNNSKIGETEVIVGGRWRFGG